MARIYTLDSVAALFHIDAATLRRWLRSACLTPHVDASDRRRRYLDSAQLLQLAESHRRMIVEIPTTSEQIAELAERVERLEAFLTSEVDGGQQVAPAL